MSFSKRIVFFALLCVSTSHGISAQVISAEESKSVDVPNEVMQQVVTRIVTWYFKAKDGKRTVQLSEDINPAWVPPMDSTKFELVPSHEVYKYKRGVLQIDSLDQEGSVYSVNVGWGRECRSEGSVWSFTVKSGRVRVWLTTNGWGSGCGGDPSPPIVRGLKIGDLSPNELPGYEFLSKGKMKDIRLGISTREDLKKLFGVTCEGVCDYDENWSVFVNYLTEDGGTESLTENGIETKTAFETKPQFVGKLRFVTMTPKKRVSFARVKFSGAFVKGEVYSIGDSFSERGFEGASHSKITTFTDGFGLQYSLFGRETFNNLPMNHPNRRNTRHENDLTEIRYELPEVLSSEMYTKRKL